MVKIEDETNWKKVVAVVIQGSVLGPVLFLIFISDINEYTPTGVNIVGDILAYIIGKNAHSYFTQEDVS